MNLRPYQQAAVDAVYEHLRSKDNNPCIVLPTGCHTKNHPILMYDGTVKKVQDIQIGDQLMGSDSTPRNVLALARGREKMAKIIPKRGNPFIVNINHLLPIRHNAITKVTCVKNIKSTDKKYLCRVVNCKEKYIPFLLKHLNEDDFFGFTLDGDHLYLDASGYVHHNTGKSVVIAKIVQDAVENWNGRVLILAHVKELLEQNASKIKALCPKIPIGIYSAGLKSKDTQENVIVAGIQSVYNKACDLGSFDLILIDEAHLIAPDGDGMYRTFLKDMKIINPAVRLIGLTATPFRLKGGLICNENNLLNEVCYEAGLKEMIQQGYLSPLISRAGRTQAKLDNLHIRGGEFIASEISEAMDNADLTNSICREIVELTKDRKSVLIFTSNIEHCNHVAEKIAYWADQECAIVSGETGDCERAEILARFKGEKVQDDFFSYKPPLKFLANVNVLTTGFDAPNVDCVVMIRPTASYSLDERACYGFGRA